MKLLKYITSAVLLFFYTGKINAFTISGPSSVNMGQTATYTASSVFGCNVDWVITGGTIIAPCNNGGTTCTTSGNTITVVWNCTSGGIHRVYGEKAGVCIGTGQLNVTVNILNIAPGSISGFTTVCANATNAYVIPLVGNATSYTWTTNNGSIVSGQGTRTANINWTNPGGTKTITLTTYYYACATTAPSTKTVLVNSIFTSVSNISGSSTVCAGATSVTYSVASVTGATSYSWVVPPNVTINSGQNTNIIHVNYGSGAQSGTISLSVSNACSSVTKTLAVTVSPLPGPAGNISGPVSACVSGGSAIYSTPPINNSTSYSWSLSGGTILSGNGTTQVNVNWGTAGTRTIAIKGSNACGFGAISTLSVNVYAQPTVAVNDTVVLNHSQMAASTSTALTIDHCANNAFCVLQTIKKAQLLVTLNTGIDHEYGTNTFSATCTVSVTGYSAHSGGSVITTFTRQLSIDQNSPEQLYVPDFTNVYSQIQRFDVKVVGYNASALIQNAIKLSATYKEVFNTQINTPNNQPLISLNTITSNTATTNKLSFSWNPVCGKFPNYEFQLLRLYNIDTAKARLGNEQQITAKVDWNNALTIETQSSATTITLSVVEGTGYYIWRVRPIGNFYEGGSANDKNWGVYTSTGSFTQGATVAVSSSISPYCFYYDQFEKDLNWMYARFFAEGDEGKTGVKIKETMTFANGLMQTKQSQTLLSTDKNILVGQSIYDFSGRAALTTMGAPVSQNYFNYVEQFVRLAPGVLYTADHFDLDNNYKNPAAMSGGALATYYSDNTPTGDNTIPNAEGFPYSRILYSKDGTGRNSEMGTPGSVHRLLQNQNEISHTKKQFFSGVSEEELLRIFGDEAPRANTVHKVINLDENNTANINYIDKEGQNIATCLSAGSNTLILDSLSESHGPIQDINDLLTDGTAISPNGMITTKPVAFITPTTLKVYYKITPKIIQAACGSYCSTCDYKVYFILRNISEPDAPGFPKKDSLIIPRGTCPSSSAGIDPFIQYANLAPGSYMVEKRIYTANINPNTGLSYLDEALTTYSNQLNAEIDPYFTAIMGYANAGDLTGLNTYLQNNLNFDSNTNQYVLSTSCSSIYIPFLNCNTASCSASNFEQALINKWSADVALGTGTNISNYFQAPWEGGDAVTAGQFNALVSNMINDPVSPYNCQALWNCWSNIVEGFKENRLQFTAMGKAYNPIEQFLQCAGKKYRGITGVKATASYSSPGYLSHAYAFIKSNLPTSTCTAAINAIAPLAYPYSDTAQWHWTNLYNCSINTNTAGSTSPQAYIDTLENKCMSLCDARYAGFVESIKIAYRNDVRYVIQGEAIPNGTQTAVSLESIYCAASKLVENCKLSCSLTLVGNQAGTTAEIDAMTKSMTSAYEVSLPDINNNCASGSTLIAGSGPDELKLLVDYLNTELEEFKANIGPGISSLTIYTLITNFNPILSGNSCFSSTTSVSVSNIISCYFYIQNTCTLRYQSPVTAPTFSCANMCKSAACNNICFKWVSPDIGPVGDTTHAISCEEQALNYIVSYIAQQRQSNLDAATEAYRQKYLTDCTKMEGLDSLKLNYKLDYYHYVLSYYDRAGHLIRTVPPAGVDLLDPALNSVKNRQVTPNHSLVTTYRYNSLGQMICKHTPDADTLKLFYNRVGQPRFSQSAQQFTTNSYAYTKYDALGRPTEKGKSTLNGSGSAFTQSVENTGFPSSGTEQTFLVYNTPTISGNYSATKTQRNLLNYISYAYTDKDGSAVTTSDRSYTYFSYDPHGNVEWLVQDLPELGKNTIAYEYDLVSRKALKVIYNEKKPDQFMHRYNYDADNRLVCVETSKNGSLWEKDASYSYYQHGPMKRLVLGEDKVQGLDYVHTIRGTLKAINHPSLDKTIDPGQDGNAGTNSKVARDVFGMMLNYYQNDFNRVGSAFNSTLTNSYYLPGTDLFNGHIISQVSNIAASGTGLKYEQAVGYTYRYDLLGRLKRSDFNYYSAGSFVTNTDYQTQYTYDANGNILTHKRNAYATSGLAMDDLTYYYYPGTNRLQYVTDAVSTTTAYTSDMETQSNTLNYTYDRSGNLKSDAQNNSTTTWDMNDRIDEVVINPAGTANDRTISFTYDAMGHRIIKKEIATATGSLIGQTFYVYDASGMLMANYKKTSLADSTFYKLNEVPLYGTERLGLRNESILVKKLISGNTITINTTTDTTLLARKMGFKLYEIKDHLNNARVIITDIKQPINTSSLSLGFTAQVQTYANFDPFGMEQVGRNYSPGAYRYGFNGMEKDNELMGEGNSYTAEFWQYDSRLGRRWNNDPVTFANESPYAAFHNNPVSFVDPNGDTPGDPQGNPQGGPVDDLSKPWNKIKNWWNSRKQVSKSQEPEQNMTPVEEEKNYSEEEVSSSSTGQFPPLPPNYPAGPYLESPYMTIIGTNLKEHSVEIAMIPINALVNPNDILEPQFTFGVLKAMPVSNGGAGYLDAYAGLLAYYRAFRTACTYDTKGNPLLPGEEGIIFFGYVPNSVATDINSVPRVLSSTTYRLYPENDGINLIGAEYCPPIKPYVIPYAYPFAIPFAYGIYKLLQGAASMPGTSPTPVPAIVPMIVLPMPKSMFDPHFDDCDAQHFDNCNK